MMLPIAVSADDILAKEYFVKAAFLFNFARLVEWPSDTFKSDADALRICLMGDEPFGEALKTIHHKKVRGRPLYIQRNISLNDLDRCHILFISKSETNNVHDILGLTTQYPVLTVSEIARFAQNNGHIRFFLTSENTLSLEINLDSIKQVNLQISSRILTLATIVSSEKSGDEAVKP